MFYEYDYNYLIKIISKEKIIYENTEYKNIIAKFCYSDKRTFKQGYEKLSKKYNDEQYEILTYQKIRRSWYECPKPRIRIKK
ncbi:hypothetical protein RO03_00600 [Fusobacterium nucleatum subsp. nucleatum]|jgi:hypothetical protein|uniref:Uncharacterized protein n=1 Tax=Fusobacterium nucleatum subsp. nucleatum TaxID=76856 RepID=A0A0M4S699_FUSNC|nr:hypothetical protein [Fusobacterium nucleatum]ALF26760.1 hypothetical protein RN95_10245 [Fusobacterium nucleatum subsp. nucleatum]KUL98074.1 hypothetical protein RO03_00600 [Fusobacterium nucleatum subsp. nucleatum]